ncbi:hypothetical protein MIMGU_mgv1a022030mg [Erythranthe guttata]|uniref:TF-B3 domain-containing protein n=1 Tax=Erythranthe guttata TaxID=4155 RepID=A0A022RH04_ERYGU|nr:hypothetical protein MIMGU_mgv1a022030mg [Erythranthe guttata]
MNFLTSNERYNLEQPKAEISATLIEPCLRECTISLRDWKTNSMMVLVNPWNEVCMRNELKQGSVIHLWSFRRNSRLCFVLVLVD